MARIHKKMKRALKGTAQKPRLSVFRSNRHIYGQLIDDVSGKTLAAASDKEIIQEEKRRDASVSRDQRESKTEIAKKTGELLAEKAAPAKIIKCVFDRRDYAFHGRVKAFANGAREKGLKF